MQTLPLTLAIAIFTVTLFSGFGIGFALAYFLRGSQTKDARATAEQLLVRAEAQRKDYESQLLELMKGKFSEVSLTLIDKAQDSFMKLAEERFKAQKDSHSSELEAKMALIDQHHLSVVKAVDAKLSSQNQLHSSDLNTKKELIDQQLGTMNSKLEGVSQLIKEFEDAREAKLGALSSDLQKLNETSSALHRALADGKARGQWGERIAENLLQLMGMQEGIDFDKQQLSDVGGIKKIRPDFTFHLPNGMRVNMDAKFPLDNYMRCIEAQSKSDEDLYRGYFLRDVKGRIAEVTSKDYISSNQSTIDCVIIFIPNEQIYRFIHEHGAAVVEDALKQKVVICSPLTLYAVLAIIKQAVENFKLQKSSHDILKLLNDFKKQWQNYTNSMDDIGKALEKAQSAYDATVKTRTRALEKPMGRIDDLLNDYDIDLANEGIQLQP